MKLVMNNGPEGCSAPPSPNYCVGADSDMGQLVIIYEKKINSKTTRKMKKTVNVNIGISTDSSGESTILSCTRERETQTTEDIDKVCAAAGGAGSTLSRPSMICASKEKYRACLCSADWIPKCSCATGSFSTVGEVTPSCAAAPGTGDGLSRPSLICSNGKEVVSCQCSADWSPSCSCSSASF